MALRNAQKHGFKPSGLSDSADATDTFPGAMSVLTNLIPAPDTPNAFVPRPASIQQTAFADFTTPAGVTALLSVGTRVYGMISTADFAGKDVPFCFDVPTSTFITITGQTSANLPTTQATTGDWTPPTMGVIAGRIVVTHPGFSGGANPFFGWIDISGFSSATMTGATHSGTKVIDTLSGNPLTSGFQPGMTISGADIPANSHIVSLTTTTITIDNVMTGSTGSVTLTVAGGTQAAPLWGAGNTTPVALVAVPVAVAQFFGRAYFAVNATTPFSDVGFACLMSQATQQLNAQNGVNITALAGLPLNSQAGGIIQSLIAFQGDANMQQIAGDVSLNNLSMNSLNVSVGTLAPNTICPTPLGLAFVAPDGLRVINFYATVSDPIGANGKGVSVPFINAVNPSRMCAAFNQNVCRISVTNGAAVGVPTQEYWYDYNQKIWSGPHDFPASQIVAYQGATGVANGHGFVFAANGIDGKLWSGEVNPSVTSTYTENGNPMGFVFQPTLLPDNREMAGNAMIETAIMAALPTNISGSISAFDDMGNLLDTLNVTGSGIAPSIWGSFTWGSGTWGAPASQMFQRALQWSKPLVFKQMTIRFTGTCVASLKIGNLYLKWQKLGYLLAA